MSARRTLCTLLLLSACGPVERPGVELGEPVENLVHVTFSSDAKGTGAVSWTANGREHTRRLGESEDGTWETTIWIPSGQSTPIRGVVIDKQGDRHESPARRVRIPSAPKKIRFDLGRVDPSRSQIGDGVIVLNAYDSKDSYAFVLNRDADVLWWMEPDRDDQRILRVRPGRDDRSLVLGRWAEKHTRDPDDGYLTRMDLSSRQSRTDTRAYRHHHDWVELPGNRFAWLSWNYSESVFVPGFGPKPIAADAIRIADEGAVEGEEQVLYDILEDYPGDMFRSCGHMAPGQFAGPLWWEWSHSNSIAYDEEADAIRFLPRYWDAVLEVGMDGVLNWQAGGLYSDFELDGWFHHAHASELTGDTLVVFDNGDHQEQPIVSRAVGLTLDFDQMVVREAWSIPDPTGTFTSFLGDVRTLPGGNVLVLWSPRGLIQEFTPGGDVVWEAQAPNGMTVARMTWSDTLEPQ